MGERVHKSILNAEVNLLFYFLSLFLAFFSRKIFLDNLGAEFIGLTGTLNNILGYLNLSELGISACIGYFLFKPLQTNNRKEIQNILSLLGYLYNWIGGIIFVAAVIVSLFFPLIFSNAGLRWDIIYFAFYSFLCSSLIGYFINYRQILLSADQKNYLVAIYYQSANLVKLGIQIYLAYHYKNLYIWVAVEFMFGIIGCIILNWKINKEYPWLQVNKKRGKRLLKKYPDIITKTKQVFIHKIKDFLLTKSDELFIFAFVSLKMVAYYGNYTMIISKLNFLVNSLLDSAMAGVGNLIAEGDKHNIIKVFWELTTLRHFLAGLMCFAIFHFIESFITLWLGAEYLLNKNILTLLCIYAYISISRGTVDMYNHANGLYSDVWSAWTELTINIVITLIVGYYWGIIGILLGKIISTSIIVILWKPYYLFKSGLHKPYSLYWFGASRNYLVTGVSFFSAHLLLNQIQICASINYISWILYCSIGLIIYLTINLLLIIFFCKGAKDSIIRIKTILIKKHNRQ